MMRTVSTCSWQRWTRRRSQGAQMLLITWDSLAPRHEPHWPSPRYLKCKISSFPEPWRVWLDLTTYIFYWCFVQPGPVTISVNRNINRLPQSCWVLWEQTPSCNFIESRGHVYQRTDLAGMESFSHLLLASKTNTSTNIVKICQGHWIHKANGPLRASISPQFTNRLPLLLVGWASCFKSDSRGVASKL